MSFEHACFISYRNGDRKDAGQDLRRQDISDTLNAFARDLRDELKRELLTHTNPKKCLIFLDQDAECLPPNAQLMPTFSQAVCKSVCMVVIFTRHYLDKDHLTCATELEGMLRRLKNRCSEMKIHEENATKWIATAVFREPDRVPAILTNNVFGDFSDYQNSSTPLRDNENYRKYIKGLAKNIADLWEDIKDNHGQTDFFKGCDTFALLDLDKQKPAIHAFVDEHRVKIKSQMPR
jgi:hypothetical protein